MIKPFTRIHPGLRIHYVNTSMQYTAIFGLIVKMATLNRKSLIFCFGVAQYCSISLTLPVDRRFL